MCVLVSVTVRAYTLLCLSDGFEVKVTFVCIINRNCKNLNLYSAILEQSTGLFTSAASCQSDSLLRVQSQVQLLMEPWWMI